MSARSSRSESPPSLTAAHLFDLLLGIQKRCRRQTCKHAELAQQPSLPGFAQLFL